MPTWRVGDNSMLRKMARTSAVATGAIAAQSLVLGSILILAAAPTGAAFAQSIPHVAEVDREWVTTAEVQRRIKFHTLWVAHHPKPPGAASDQPLGTPSREAVVNLLRRETLSLREARKAQIEIADDEVDREYARLATRMSLTADQLTMALAGSGSDAETVRQLIRAGLAQKRLAARSRELNGWRE